MEQQVIPEGYKHSQFGAIPNEWKCKELGYFINQLVAGISVNSVETDDVSGQKCVLKTSCIYGGVFIENEAKLIATKDLKRAKLNPIKGSIIISRMNTPALVGEIGYINKDYTDRYLPDRLWQTSFKRNVNLDSKWLSYCLSYSPVSKAIKETATGTSDSMKNISKGGFLSVVVPTPTYKEQTAIANALSDVDALIASIEKLIAKKQAIKTATMQQLLTGKKRLPPFDKHPDGTPKGTQQTELGEIPEDWEIGTLSDFIGALEAGISVNSVESMEAFGHGKCILKTSCVSGGYFIPSEGKGIIPSDVNRAKVNPRKGSIIISRMNTPALVGEIGYVDGDFQDLYLPDRLWQTKFKPNVNFDSRWLAYILSFPVVAKKIKETATGTSDSMKNISKPSILSINFPCPLPEEQTVIAKVISSMDSEIKSTKKRLTKTKKIKQGMMQELLTGKTRLV